MMKTFECIAVREKTKKEKTIIIKDLVYVFEAESDQHAKLIFENYMNDYVTLLATKTPRPYSRFNKYSMFSSFSWVMANKPSFLLQERGSTKELASINFEELKSKIESYEENFVSETERGENERQI